MVKKTVTRSDLYRAVNKKVGLSYKQSAIIVELVLKEITDCLERGETVMMCRRSVRSSAFSLVRFPSG